jgi:hypothetical protein
MLKLILNISMCISLSAPLTYAAQTELLNHSGIQIRSNVLELEETYKIDLQENYKNEVNLEELATNLLARIQGRENKDRFFYVSVMRKICSFKRPAIGNIEDVFDIIDRLNRVDIKSIFMLTYILKSQVDESRELAEFLEMIADSKADQQQHIVNTIINLTPHDVPRYHFLLLHALKKFNSIKDRNGAVELSTPYFSKINDDFCMGHILNFVGLNETYRDEIIDIFRENDLFLANYSSNDYIMPFSNREFLQIRPFLSTFSCPDEMNITRNSFDKFSEEETGDFEDDISELTDPDAEVSGPAQNG